MRNFQIFVVVYVISSILFTVVLSWLFSELADNAAYLDTRVSIIEDYLGLGE